jgi:hypothetical protein
MSESVYPHQPQNQRRESLAVLADLVQRHGVTLISIGNGTASRETEQLAAELILRLGAVEKGRQGTRAHRSGLAREGGSRLADWRFAVGARYTDTVG